MRIPLITSELTAREYRLMEDFASRQKSKVEGYASKFVANSFLNMEMSSWAIYQRRFHCVCRLALNGYYTLVPGMRDAQILWRSIRVSRAADRLGKLADQAGVLIPES